MQYKINVKSTPFSLIHFCFLAALMVAMSCSGTQVVTLQDAPQSDKSETKLTKQEETGGENTLTTEIRDVDSTAHTTGSEDSDIDSTPGTPMTDTGDALLGMQSDDLPADETTAPNNSDQDPADTAQDNQPRPTFVYVSASNSKEVHVFELNYDDQMMTPKAVVALDGSAGPIATSADGTALYVTSGEEIVSYDIDQSPGESAGTLSRMKDATGQIAHGVQIGYFPVYLALDGSESNLLTTGFDSGQATVFALDEATRLATYQSPGPVSTEHGDAKPHAIVSDPRDEFVLVPMRDANGILLYRYDSETGALTLMEDGRGHAPDSPEKAGPRHIAIASNGIDVYVINELSGSITHYQLDRIAPKLNRLETVPTLPSNVDNSGFTCADIHLSPDGNFIYGSNRHNAGHSSDHKDSIVVYKVNADGSLAHPTDDNSSDPYTVGTVEIPRDFNIDPTGRFLIVAGQRSNNVALYDILPDGTLDAAGRTPLPAGSSPLWVEVVTLKVK